MINPLGSFPLGEIASFGLWIQKQRHRASTIQYSIQAIKPVVRRPNLLDLESVKTYAATANVTEARKPRPVEDLDRFYRWKHVPFQKRNYRRIENLRSYYWSLSTSQILYAKSHHSASSQHRNKMTERLER